MKRNILIVFLSLLGTSPIIILTSLLSASFTPPVSSWYNAAPSTETGLSLYAPAPSYFDIFNFDTNMNGFYSLSNATFTTSYTGLVRLSGICSQAKPAHVALALVFASNGYIYPLADSSEAIFSFSYAFPAGALQIQAVTYATGQYDLLKCNLLFEKVQ